MVKSIDIRPTVIGISSCTYYLVYTSVEEKVFNLISRGSPARLFEVKGKNNLLEKLGCSKHTNKLLLQSIISGEHVC